ncbi:MAG: hypothetical protein K8L91_16390 [Anaerolineae bacterium]|nr:hypothetical protein [Anaerolineae bacterium]
MPNLPSDDTLQKILTELEPENHLGALLTVQMGGTPEEVQLLLQTTEFDEARNGLRPTGSYIIRCLGVREHRVSVGLFNSMVYTETHSLLWNHNYPFQQVYFSGMPDNVDGLMLELTQLYGQHYGNFRTLADDLNRAMPLGKLLTSGRGLLGEMPIPMTERIQKLLEGHGLAVSLIDSDQNPPEAQHALLVMDDSFFIAQLYSADPLEGKN